MDITKYWSSATSQNKSRLDGAAIVDFKGADSDGHNEGLIDKIFASRR